MGSYKPPSPFNGNSQIPPVTTLNVSYSGKYNETYLVAPNVHDLPTFLPLYRETINPDGTPAPNMYAPDNGVTDYDYEPGQRNFYIDAYTFEDAQAMCSNFGGTLATPGQIEIAAQLGGYWAVAGWGSDRNRYAIIPQKVACDFSDTLKYTINGSSAPLAGSNAGSNAGTAYDAWCNTKKIDPPPPYDPLRLFKTDALPARTSKSQSGSSGQLTAFPICWGVKPTQPTLNVVSFNELDYSMFTRALIASVINPDPSDLFQVSFTPDQGVYALQQTNYNINDGETNPARQLLVGDSGSTGFANVNQKIYQAAAGSDKYNEDNVSLTHTPCTILLKTFNNFQKQFASLRTLMRDVSGGVIAMQSAKGENADFQMSLETICEIESPTTSPACARLATLDYDILYNTDTSDISTTRIATLELLNHNLFIRQNELCMAMQNLFRIQDILNCPSSNGSLPDCVYKTFGTYAPILMIDGMQENNVEYLRLLLQQISPYFGVATYQTLIGGILKKLSVMIDLPDLNDYNTAIDNLNAVDENTKATISYLEYDRAMGIV